MYAKVKKPKENKSRAVANSVVQKKSEGEQGLRFVDNRPETVAQRKLQAMTDNYSARQQQPIQKKTNNTGLPDNLKSGIENLSGYAMDDVKVHYNSDKPAQLQAHAYAKGTDIHLASGQEKHLPHEAWHVVQKKQGRVIPTRQMKGMINVNDDAGLEKEADMMGVKALQYVENKSQVVTEDDSKRDMKNNSKPNIGQAIQRKVGLELELPQLTIGTANPQTQEMKEHASREEKEKQHSAVKYIDEPDYKQQDDDRPLKKELSLVKTKLEDETKELDSLKWQSLSGEVKDNFVWQMWVSAGSKSLPNEIMQKLKDSFGVEESKLVDLHKKYQKVREQTLDKAVSTILTREVNKAIDEDEDSGYETLGTYEGDVQLDADHTARKFAPEFEEHRGGRTNIIELVLKEVGNKQEANERIGQVTKWLDQVWVNTDDMKKPGKIPSSLGKYDSTLRLGPDIELNKPILERSEVIGNIQVNLGIPLAQYMTITEKIINDRKFGEPDPSDSTRLKNQREESAKAAETVLENIKKSTDQAGVWLKANENSKDGETFKGYINVLAEAIYNIYKISEFAQDNKNRHDFLSKTQWSEMRKLMLNVAQTELNNGEAKHEKIVEALLKEVLKSKEKEAPKSKDNPKIWDKLQHGTNLKQWKESETKMKPKRDARIEQRIRPEEASVRADDGDYSIKPGELESGGTNQRKHPVFEYRSIQDRNVAEGKWLELLKNYVDLTSEMNTKDKEK